MRKGWKIFWIVCASLFGLGIVLCIAGGVMGATMSTIQQAFWETAAVKDYRMRGEKTVERLDDAVEYVEENNFENEKSSENTVLAQLDGIKSLDVDVTYIIVKIVEDDVDSIVLESSGIPKRVEGNLKFTQDRDELEIEVRNQAEWKKAMVNNGDGTLTIRIPKDKWFRSMSLSIGAGVLEADRILADELDIEVGAGVANVGQFEADTFDLECAVGEAYVSGKAARESKVECGIGKVEYNAAGSQLDYDYKLEVGAGTLIVGNDEYNGMLNERKIQNGSGVLMEIECGVGEVTVTFDEE